MAIEMNISETIRYIGVDDMDLDLFESQYPVPEGMAYNSYLILDEKIAIMDTVDERKKEAYIEKLLGELDGRTPDYVVVQHMEPDHSGSLLRILELFPEITLVASAKALQMIPQFFDTDLSQYKTMAVKEGEGLSLGAHSLKFTMAPMVHWPEVMMTYEESEKVLFAADAFGKFGANSLMEEGWEMEDWSCEARRYYFNIVGKYGMPVQTVLKKAALLDIRVIAPLHGPVLRDKLADFIALYQTWSSYQPENLGTYIAVASIHGNTMKAAEVLKNILEEKGEKVVLADLSRVMISEAVEDAFRYDRMILCASSYDAGVFLPMEDFLHHLASKAYQKRTVGLMENGSWAPTAARTMKTILETMKDVTVIEPVVTIKSSLKTTDLPNLAELAARITER